MSGYHGKMLRINLTTGEITTYKYPEGWKRKYIGGRGFTTKYLWDNIKPGTDPLGPENILMFAVGPLTGHSLPSSGKMVVAAKSPITRGYGDGNLGTRAAPLLRKAGYDGIIIEGKAEKPVYISIDNEKVEILDAGEIWGKNISETEEYLISKYKKSSGFLSIGPAGENLVKYATVRSQEGRSGGRPGMGAVMGSKNLKSIVINGSLDLPAVDRDGIKTLGREGYNAVKNAPAYEHWMAEGTTMVLEWCNETSSLPTRNFAEAKFENYVGVSGQTLAETKIKQIGCPGCNMHCGMVIIDDDEKESELDYENIGMLGPNVGIGEMKKVGSLNRLADEYGLDTISLGSVLGMAVEAAKNGKLDIDIDFGDYNKLRELVDSIAHRKGDIGDLLAEGTMRMAEKMGDEAKNWAIQVKGLECSAYNAFTLPGMSLSFGTSPIGAHHKDAWVISWEISESDRDSYGPEKADKVIELQRIRGGMFESLVTCRFPWIELGYELDNYPKYLKMATGEDWSLEQIFEVSDRIYALMRSFWVREFNADGKTWDRSMDYPPQRWFNEKLGGSGPYAGKNLDRDKYNTLLNYYYDKRGWDDRGIPKKETFERLNLKEEAEKLADIIELK